MTVLYKASFKEGGDCSISMISSFEREISALHACEDVVVLGFMDRIGIMDMAAGDYHENALPLHENPHRYSVNSVALHDDLVFASHSCLGIVCWDRKICDRGRGAEGGVVYDLGMSSPARGVKSYGGKLSFSHGNFIYSVSVPEGCLEKEDIGDEVFSYDYTDEGTAYATRRWISSAGMRKRNNGYENVRCCQSYAVFYSGRSLEAAAHGSPAVYHARTGCRIVDVFFVDKYLYVLEKDNRCKDSGCMIAKRII